MVFLPISSTYWPYLGHLASKCLFPIQILQNIIQQQTVDDSYIPITPIFRIWCDEQEFDPGPHQPPSIKFSPLTLALGRFFAYFAAKIQLTK